MFAVIFAIAAYTLLGLKIPHRADAYIRRNITETAAMGGRIG